MPQEPSPHQPLPDTASALLDARGISRRFGGVVALDDVSVTIRAHEIFGLIGPNGAGKTTFFDVITGLCDPDSGSCSFDGRALPLGRPHRIVARGIARTFQNIRLFRELSVRENVMAACDLLGDAGVLASLLRTGAARAGERAVRSRADEVLDYIGLGHLADSLAKNLSYGDQRRLEIARALATGPKMLALDEPAAGMNATETAALRCLIERIRADGTTVLLIEHDVKLVMSLCDRVAVLDSGRKIAEGVPDAIANDDTVVEAYLGRRHLHAR